MSADPLRRWSGKRGTGAWRKRAASWKTTTTGFTSTASAWRTTASTSAERPTATAPPRTPSPWLWKVQDTDRTAQCSRSQTLKGQSSHLALHFWDSKLLAMLKLYIWYVKLLNFWRPSKHPQQTQLETVPREVGPSSKFQLSVFWLQRRRTGWRSPRTCCTLPGKLCDWTVRLKASRPPPSPGASTVRPSQVRPLGTGR